MTKRLFFILPLLSGFFIWHKFYVSVTTITFNDEKKFEIILYTFPDDLEKAILQRFRYEIDLDLADRKTRFYIETYLKERFQISINGKKIDYRYLGFTFENEKILLLCETDKVRKPKEIKVVQKWLTDVYSEQQNIVHIILPDKKFSEILHKDKVTFEVEIR